MNRREMRKRIAGVIASHIVGFKETIPDKTLNQRLEEEFEFICKFKNPTRAQINRWETAKHEVRMILWNHAGL